MKVSLRCWQSSSDQTTAIQCRHVKILESLTPYSLGKTEDTLREYSRGEIIGRGAVVWYHFRRVATVHPRVIVRGTTVG